MLNYNSYQFNWFMYFWHTIGIAIHVHTSSRCRDNSITTGITDDRVTYSSPLIRDVYTAKGLRNMWTFSSCFQSLVGRLSHSSSCRTVANLVWMMRKVELHLVGQSFINFWVVEATIAWLTIIVLSCYFLGLDEAYTAPFLTAWLMQV